MFGARSTDTFSRREATEERVHLKVFFANRSASFILISPESSYSSRIACQRSKTGTVESDEFSGNLLASEPPSQHSGSLSSTHDATVASAYAKNGAATGKRDWRANRVLN